MEAEIKKAFPDSKIKLISSGGGVFEIKVNDDLIFSKKALGRFPESGEVVSIIKN